MRSIVSLALDALAAPDARHGKLNSYNQRLICAMRLRYGLDDDRPRTLKEVRPVCRGGLHSLALSCLTMRRPQTVATSGARLAACQPSVVLPSSTVAHRRFPVYLEYVRLCQLLTAPYHAIQVSQEMHNSIETVRILIEEGKEQLAEILAQMGLMKDIQMSA